MTESTAEEKQLFLNLKFRDTDKKTIKVPLEIKQSGDITVLRHDIFTSGINYVDFVL